MRFCCPKCFTLLVEQRGKVAVCENGHSYDKSKYGYYNLLLSASGGGHGDNAEMVAARRDFLALGHYRKLADAVAEAVLAALPRGAALLDAGCGEGYYTEIVSSALALRDGECDVSAFDISKDAVRQLKKKAPAVSAAVASSYRIPICDGTLDCVLNMFSPNAAAEFLRVLVPRGKYVMVIPAEEHLYELKAAVYENPYKNTVADTAIDGFKLLSEKRLRYRFTLDSMEKIASLFLMTPYAYRTKKEEREKLFSLESLSVTADFLIFTYEKE